MGELYGYGMTLRPFAPGCQPKGSYEHVDFDTRVALRNGRQIWSMVWYERPLTEQELDEYEMIELPEDDSYEMLNIARWR